MSTAGTTSVATGFVGRNSRLGKKSRYPSRRRVFGHLSRERPRGSGELAYDPRRRSWIGESVTTYSDGSHSSVHTTDYVYDGNQIVLQFDATSTPGTSVSLTVADLSHRYLSGPAVDQVLADEQLAPATGGGYDLTSPGNVVWTLADNEGTIRDLAVYNAQTGLTTVANHRIYDPFGKLVSQTNPAIGNAAAVDCLFGYTGCATDSNADIEFHERRVKTSGSPDWLSPDPISLTSGVTNLDDYCGNDPINATDPSGLWFFESPSWYHATKSVKTLPDGTQILTYQIWRQDGYFWTNETLIRTYQFTRAPGDTTNYDAIVMDIVNQLQHIWTLNQFADLLTEEAVVLAAIEARLTFISLPAAFPAAPPAVAAGRAALSAGAGTLLLGMEPERRQWRRSPDLIHTLNTWSRVQRHI